MPSFSQPSRAETLLQDAIALGVDELHVRDRGGEAEIQYRFNAGISREPEWFSSDFEGLSNEIKALITEMNSEDEYEWWGWILFPTSEQSVWIQAGFIFDRKGSGFFLHIQRDKLGLSDLGLSNRCRATLEKLMSAPQGVVVGCGSAGCGHATTLNAILEFLAQNGKRVVTLADWPDPRLQGVTQIDTIVEESNTQMGWLAQAEALANQFDVIALGNLRINGRGHMAFDLAARGHLVFGLIYSPPVAASLSYFLGCGLSPDTVWKNFLGGWSQMLVRRASGQGCTGLFECMSCEMMRHCISERAESYNQAIDDEEEKALCLDIREKIVMGLITREDVVRRFPYLETKLG